MIEIILVTGLVIITYYLSKITLYLKTILIGFQTYADNQRVSNSLLTADKEEELFQRAEKGEKRAKEVLDMIDKIIAKRQDKRQRGEF